MRPNLPFLSAASNANLKPDGFLKWKKRLVKDVRLLLPLTEAMKIARLRSMFHDVPRQSLPPFCRWHFFLIFHLFHFPQSFLSRESASVFANYLRSHSSVSLLKTLRSRVRGYLSELRRVTCPEESHLFVCSPFSPAKFLAGATNFFFCTATGPDKVAYPILKHLPCSGIDLLPIFNLFWTSHSFPSIHLEDIFCCSRP